MTVDLAGGDPEPISDRPAEDPGRFLDGTSVLTSSGGEIILIDLDGNVLETIQEASAVLFGPVWSADGEWIALSGASGEWADVFISRIDGEDRWQVMETPPTRSSRSGALSRLVR